MIRGIHLLDENQRIKMVERIKMQDELTIVALLLLGLLVWFLVASCNPNKSDSEGYKELIMPPSQGLEKKYHKCVNEKCASDFDDQCTRSCYYEQYLNNPAGPPLDDRCTRTCAIYDGTDRYFNCVQNCEASFNPMDCTRKHT